MSNTLQSIVIVDTGPLVALINQDDEHHTPCLAWLEKALRERRKLVVPVPVVTEVCYLLKRSAGTEYEAKFLEELARMPSDFRLFYPGRKAFSRMGRLVRKYHDLPLGAVDAAVVAAAEHFGTTEIATIDGRMVATVRVHDLYPIISHP